LPASAGTRVAVGQDDVTPERRVAFVINQTNGAWGAPILVRGGIASSRGEQDSETRGERRHGSPDAMGRQKGRHLGL